MGGSGSGWRGWSKTTVASCLVLSAAKLMRFGVLRSNVRCSGSVTWTNTDTGGETSSIGFAADTGPDFGSVRLHYTRTSTGEAMDYHVNLTTTPLPWGGRRWWFMCPLTVNGRYCGRRVGKLYLRPGRQYFGCRHCHNLTYTSCQESHKFDRLYALIGGQLGESPADVARMMREMLRGRGRE